MRRHRPPLRFILALSLLGAGTLAWAAEDAAPAAASPLPVVGAAWTVPDLGMAMRPVAPGQFMRGSLTGKSNEQPVHEVRITRPYWLGQTEVSFKQWKDIMVKHRGSYTGKDELPMRNITYYDATSFCKRLTEREQAAGRLPEGHVYRLPTEAEWEYAARGGEHGQEHAFSGSDTLDEVGWAFANSGNRPIDDAKWSVEMLRIIGNRPHPVGEKGANALGLHDMSGNVWEWCHDWHGPYSAGAVTDPVGPRLSKERVTRGGGWYSDASNCRVTTRNPCVPSSMDYGLGFRVALAPALPPPPPPADAHPF